MNGELTTTGLIVAGTFRGISDALLGPSSAVPVSEPARAEQAVDLKNVWIIGGIALAALVGIVLLAK